MRKLLPLIVVLFAAAGGPSALGAGGVSVDPGDLSFGTVATNDSTTQPETITNASGGDVVISLDTGSNGAFSIVNDNCSGTLPDTQTCGFDVRYHPTSSGSDSSTLTVDEGAAGTDTFSLSGSAVANRFQLVDPTPSPGFGTVAVGETSDAKQVKVQNHTDFSADPNPHMVGPDSGDFDVSGCGSNVDGGNDCTASVTFSPSSQGPESATLQFDGASFDFTGTGAQPVDVQPLSLDFGDQHVGTNSASQPVTVTNNRSQAIGVSITNGNSADYNVTGCGGQLAAHDSCTILVVFSPNAVGQQNGTLTVEGQDVQLTGRGIAAVADVSPGSISFGNQPVFTLSAAQTVTVKNTGNDFMHIAAPTLGGTNPAQFSISDACQAATPLPPNGQCTITVTFAPTVPAAADAVLQLNSDASSGQQTVQLHGTGTPSAVAFKPGPVLFERPHHAGTFSTPKTITLTNRTSGPLTISKVRLTGSNPNSFRITGGTCGGADHRGGCELHRDGPVRPERGRGEGSLPDRERRRPQLAALGRAERHGHVPQGRRRGARRGRLRRDQDHVETGRIVEPLRSHRHPPKSHPRSDRAR